MKAHSLKNQLTNRKVAVKKKEELRKRKRWTPQNKIRKKTKKDTAVPLKGSNIPMKGSYRKVAKAKKGFIRRKYTMIKKKTEVNSGEVVKKNCRINKNGLKWS